MRDLIVIIAIVIVALVGARTQLNNDNSDPLETTGGYSEEAPSDEVSSESPDATRTPVTTKSPTPAPLKADTSGALIVVDQAPGDTVTVESVTLSSPTWVAVHEERTGALGNVLGAAWLPAGTHKNVTVELLRGTVGGGAYYAALYEDNGNKQFEYRTDKASSDSLGNHIVVRFSAGK